MTLVQLGMTGPHRSELVYSWPCSRDRSFAFHLHPPQGKWPHRKGQSLRQYRVSIDFQYNYENDGCSHSPYYHYTFPLLIVGNKCYYSGNCEVLLPGSQKININTQVSYCYISQEWPVKHRDVVYGLLDYQSWKQHCHKLHKI